VSHQGAGVLRGLDALRLDHRLTIRGESHYMPHLRRLLNGGDRWHASLVREPHNEYDKNAIKVVIDGGCVGYVAREQAETIAPQLDQLQQQGYAVGFAAVLCGGTKDKPNIGVFPDD
jgi:hypothetical protein